MYSKKSKTTEGHTFLQCNSAVRKDCICLAIIEASFLALNIALKSVLHAVLSALLIYYFILLYQYLDLSEKRIKKYKYPLLVLFFLFLLHYAEMLYYVIFMRMDKVIHSVFSVFVSYVNLSTETAYDLTVFVFVMISLVFIIHLFRRKKLLSGRKTFTSIVNRSKLIRWSKSLVIGIIPFILFSIYRQVSAINLWEVSPYTFRLLADLLFLALSVLFLIRFEWINKSKTVCFLLLFALSMNILFSLSYLYIYALSFSTYDLPYFPFVILNVLFIIQFIRIRINSK